MGSLFGFILGVVVGSLLVILIKDRKRIAGTLVVDKSDDNKDLYRFEIDDLDKLQNMKSVELAIKHAKGPSRH